MKPRSLFAVYEAAEKFVDARCSRLTGCEAGWHNASCALLNARDSLVRTVDAARKESK